MSSIGKVVTLPVLTIAAAIESFLPVKLYGDEYTLRQQALYTAGVFFVNYGFFCLFWVFLHPFFLSPLSRLPGPRTLLTPTQMVLVDSKREAGDIFIDISEQYPDQELIYLSPIQRQILVKSPRLMADLFVHRSYDFVKPPQIGAFLKHTLGNGLVVVEGDTHKFLRKNTMPAFGFRHIKELYPMMWGKAKLMAQILRQKEVDGDKSAVVEISTWASKATLDIIGIAGLGRQFNTLEMASDPLMETYEELLDPSREKLAFALASFIIGRRTVGLLPWRMNANFDRITARLSDICMSLIQDKRRAITQDKDDHFDILALLLQSGNFSDVDLKDQLLTFLAAGHETTSSSFTWACYLLAKHQTLQETLRQEIAKALPTSGPIDDTDLASTLEQLPYLNGIMNETFRLYPTVPVTFRQATKDTHLADHPIPEGTTVAVSMWMTNRSPALWGADANDFRPERWISPDGRPNQSGGATGNYDFLTFLHGPRSCIGQGFARAEMRCLLAALVRGFRWELAMEEKDVVPRGVITIKPANGMYLRLTPLQ
jgi:cytochrome P450